MMALWYRALVDAILMLVVFTFLAGLMALYVRAVRYA
jgi:hypothetical protein